MPLMSLRERRDLCRALKDLAGRQREALAARDYDGLIELLGERKALLGRLASLGPSLGEWAASRDSLADSERAEGDRLWAEARSLLAELARAEHEAVAELTSQRDATQAELREIAAAGRVNAAYRDSLAPVTHRSLDVDR